MIFAYKMSWDIILAIIVCVLVIIYLYLREGQKYWDKRGVISRKPNFIFGNFLKVLLRTDSMLNMWTNNYKEYSQHQFIGLFSFQRPILMLNDPDLIKLILTKDFKYFQNRGLDLLNDKEPLTQHLFNLQNEKWKCLRKKLTPTFTSGKIKSMFQFIKECSENLKIALDNEINLRKDVECKDLMARYTTDTIGSCAFGIETNSLSQPDAEFRMMGIRIFKPRFEHVLRLFFKDISRTLISILDLRFFEKIVENFFMKTVADVVNYRESNGIVRGDFLDLLIAMKSEDSSSSCNNSGNKNGNVSILGSDDQHMEMTLPMITAQCFLFFAAGFETSSSTLSFCLLELAKNLDCQKKLQTEIDDVLNKFNGQLTYDVLKEMKYLDMVVSETLRMYPPLYILTRKCCEDYTIPGTNVVIEKNIEVIIPIFGIQRDSKYFENPEIFNPENFTEERKATRYPFSYIPFGEGPRICIGLRFGMLQVKTAIATILQHYNVMLSSRTELPIRYVDLSFVTNSEGGIWLKFDKR